MNDILLSGEDDYYRGFLSFYRLLNAVKWADGVDLSTLVPSGVWSRLDGLLTCHV